ncbi:MAG: TonB-dependent receptor plug domain-containing protein [Bacteroidia bacterium]
MSTSKYIFIKSINKVIFTLLMLGSVCIANAQTAIDTIKSRGLNEIIVTGQIGESTQKSSVLKVKVIDIKRINLQGAYNLPSLLANELNVRINYDPMLGNSISLQGISGQNIKVMIDGVSVIGREGGSIDLSQINLSSVERIEMIEGPMGVNFGSDAMGGVINIITKKTVKNHTKICAGTYAESIGQYNFDLQANTGFKKFGIQTNFQRNFFQGFATDETSRSKTWKPRTQYLADLNFSYFLKNGTLRFNNSFFDEKTTDKGISTINSFEGTATDQYYLTRRLGSSLFYDVKLNKKWSLNVIATYQNYRRIRKSVFVDLTTMNEQLVNDAEMQDTNYFNLYMSRGILTNRTANKKLSYQIGYEANIDEVTGTKIQNGYATIGDYGLFGSAEIKVNKQLLVRPSVRFVYNTQFVAPIIPSLNLKFDFNSNWAMRASYARGFRAPSLKELHLAFVDPNHSLHGNENLKAETGHNFQLAFTRTTRIYKNYILTIEPMLFYNKINNMIDLVRLNATTVAAQYNNISNFENAGFNLNTGVTSNTVSMQIGYAFSAKQNSIMAQAGTNTYFYTNEFRANTSYTYTRTETSISLFYKYNGAVQNYQYNVGDNSIILGNIADFSLLDFTVNKYFLKRKINVTLGSKNILNTTSVQANLLTGPHGSSGNSALIAMGRTYFATLKINLDFITSDKNSSTNNDKAVSN